MPKPSAPRPLRHLALAAVLLAAALPVLALDSVTLELAPSTPTWRADLRMTVRGRTVGVVEASAPVLGFEVGVGWVYDVTLSEIGTPGVPGPPQPFSLGVDLGHLAPGDYTVRLALAGAAPGAYLAKAPLNVYETLDLAIGLPDEAVTDDAPFSFSVRGVACCPSLGDAVVDGPFIDVELSNLCPFLPPPEAYFEQSREVGPLPAGDYLVRVFETGVNTERVATRQLRVHDSARCVPSPTVLCLGGDRFRIEVAWQDFQGGDGAGQAVPLPGRDDTGLFWFFNPANVELTVKVLDGCGVNGRYWVFVSSGSTVAYELTVTDLDADQSRAYGNDSGETPALIPDTGAFATCP